MPSPNRPQVLLFDVNETLLDLSPLRQAINQEFGFEFAFTQWFGLLLQYSLVETVTGSYHDFRELGGAALTMLAQALGQPARPAARQHELLAVLAELPPHPDVSPGLEALRQAGFRLATLTNSPGATLQKQLAHAGLAHFFEQALSIDEGQRYKPHPATYHTACQRLGIAPADTLLVAAHGWDVAGALRAGLAAAFVARPGQAEFPLGPPPTYTAPTLVDLAHQLAAGTL